MTWLRFDTDAAQSDVVGHLAEALGLPVPHAFGCYVATCLAFGAHRPDGRADCVTDTTLEQWACWTGKRGRFAAAFRARCVDADGVVRGWWRQDALLAWQERKNKRPNAKTRAARQKSGEGPAPGHPEKEGGGPRRIYDGNDTERNGTSSTTTSSTPATAESVGLPTDYQPDLDAILRSASHPTVVLTAVRTLTAGRHPGLETVTPQDVGEGLRALLLDRAPAAKLSRYVQTANRMRVDPFVPAARNGPRTRQNALEPPKPATRRRDPYAGRQRGVLTVSLGDVVPAALAELTGGGAA